ncbi:PREDICTED: protein DA1-like [Populus euphratica]|uniref:Protein DA1-like n=1 Tax=Populus euphratica TaxID=75702 RepID=A0AAJ6T4Y4_POPEU|nr:PREDICTED: protein DA1-like [Populus euphratica]
MCQLLPPPKRYPKEDPPPGAAWTLVEARSVMKLIPRNEKFVSLGDDRRDGRRICNDCFSTAILETQGIEPLVRYVLRFFDHLNMKIKAPIPVFSVDRGEMRRQTAGGTAVGVKSNPFLFFTWPLFKIAVQIEPVHPDTTVLGLTMCSDRDITSVDKSRLQGRKVATEMETYRFGHEYRIKILVLFGLPWVMTGGILAHEFMHAWLRLQGVSRLNPEIEEGICQVMGYQWLDWFEAVDPEASSGRSEKAQFTRNLKKTFKGEVENMLDGAYGDGFRDAQWAVSRYGLDHVIRHIIRYKTLPRG